MSGKGERGGRGGEQEGAEERGEEIRGKEEDIGEAPWRPQEES